MYACFTLFAKQGNHRALDQLVWVLVDDVAVLEGPRLGFVRIDDQVNGLAALAVDERPLDRHRESRRRRGRASRIS